MSFNQTFHSRSSFSFFQELLTDSSDDRSEYWNVSTRNSRKCRGRRDRACPGFLKACNAFLACASVLATASLIWLFIDVRQQLTALRTELDQGTGLIFSADIISEMFMSSAVRLKDLWRKGEPIVANYERYKTKILSLKAVCRYDS